ncbi:MAG: fasciclin domain-containing protein, partial [Prevotella sp.]|nr:fasciclin domain-containing protein [Prevotella sp.]
MNNCLMKLARRVFLIGAGIAVMASCNPEPNEADLYTFTGETIGSFIAKDSTLTAFNYILKTVGYDKMMSAYGHYTCYAPTNDGVIAYCDSLYNDIEATLPHNGMRKPEGATYGDDAYSTLEPEERLKWLSDSLCLNIARFHLTTTYQNVVAMTGLNVPVTTMLGYNFTCNIDNEGRIVLNNKAVIVNSDNETINGLVHVVDNVIPRFTRFIGDILNRDGRFEIFAQALEVTGWADSLKKYKKEGEFTFVQRVRENYNSKITAPTECKVGFTLFAETDDVIKAALKREGFTEDFDGLVDYANKVYGNAPQWYDYMNENGLTVNTDKNEEAYKQTFNALNMFVAYHILGCSMMPENLVL